MSLVVAQETEDGPRIVSDTRVGFDARRSNFKTGTLKAIVLTREVTICFAGDVSVGLDRVRRYLGQTFIHVGRDITVKSGENLVAKMAQPVEEEGTRCQSLSPHPGLGPELSSRTHGHGLPPS